MKSAEHVHGRYVVKTFTSGAKVSARAFAGGRPAVPVVAAKGKSVDMVLSTIGNLLDGRDSRERTARQNGVPTAQEFADAFIRQSKKIKERHWLMLEAMLAAPNRTMSMTELATSAGYPSYVTANAHFGTLAGWIADDLGFKPDPSADGTQNRTAALATGDPEYSPKQGDWRWTMRKEVADCLSMNHMGRPVA